MRYTFLLGGFVGLMSAITLLAYDPSEVAPGPLESVAPPFSCPEDFKRVIVLPILPFDAGTLACAPAATLRGPVQ